ncbi:MAG: hypothetical protein Q4G51_13325 [Dermatophilus congolensis]|nr:hypothetical protein [Dermatophilus congolensis]
MTSSLSIEAGARRIENQAADRCVAAHHIVDSPSLPGRTDNMPVRAVGPAINRTMNLAIDHVGFVLFGDATLAAFERARRQHPATSHEEP